MKLFRKYKLILCYIGLILICLLMGNSNNVPEIYMERILKPISWRSSTFYYANIIAIFIIYYCLKGINKNKENYFINSTFARIMATIILINGFAWSGEYITKFYKSFYHNLNSIYMNRDGTSVEFNGNNKKLNINGEVAIVNCSNKIQEFHIKIKSPAVVKDHTKKDYIIIKNNVKIYPKEKINIYIEEELDGVIESENLEYNTHAFEYILFNNEDDAVFKGNIDDYNIDYLNSKY